MPKRHPLILIASIACLQVAGMYLLFRYDTENFAKNMSLIALSILVMAGLLLMMSFNTKNISYEAIIALPMLLFSVVGALFILYHVLYLREALANLQYFITMVTMLPIVSMQLISFQKNKLKNVTAQKS